MLNELQASDFSPWLNQTWHIRFTPEVSLPAELIQVQEVDSYTKLERKPFSIVFRTAQKDQYYNQVTCILEHPQKGDLTVFFVPLGFDGTGMMYEAVFA